MDDPGVTRRNCGDGADVRLVFGDVAGRLGTSGEAGVAEDVAGRRLLRGRDGRAQSDGA